MRGSKAEHIWRGKQKCVWIDVIIFYFVKKKIQEDELEDNLSQCSNLMTIKALFSTVDAIGNNQFAMRWYLP